MSDSEDGELSPSEMPLQGSDIDDDDGDDYDDDNGPSTSWGQKKRKRPIGLISDSDEDEAVDDALKDEGDSCDSDSSGGVPGAETCAICLGRMRGEVGSPDTCEHTFCEFCLLEWSKTNPSCPQDRIPFSFVIVRKSLDGPIAKKVPVKQKEKEILEIDLTLENPTYCEVCNECNREERLLLCDGCDLGYHLECLNPPLSQVPVEEWFCSACTAANVPRVLSNRRRTSNPQPVAVSVRRGASQSSRPHQQPDTPRIPRTRATERIRATIQDKKRRKRKQRRANKRARIASGEIEDPRPPVMPSKQFIIFGVDDADVDAEHKEDRYADHFLHGVSVEAARHPAQRRADAARRLRDVAFIPQSSYAGRTKNRVMEIVNTQSEDNQTDVLSGILENQAIAFSSSKKLFLTNERKLTKQPGVEIPIKDVDKESSFTPVPLPSQRKSPEKTEIDESGSSSGEISKDNYEDNSKHSRSQSNDRQRSPSRSNYQHPSSMRNSRERRKDSSHGNYKRDDYGNRRHGDLSRNIHHNHRYDENQYSRSSSYSQHLSSSWQSRSPWESSSYGRQDRKSYRKRDSFERKSGNRQSRDCSPSGRSSSNDKKGREERSPNSKYDKNRSHHSSKSHFSESKGKSSLSSANGEGPVRSQWSYNYFNSDNLFSKSNGSNNSNNTSSINVLNDSKAEVISPSESNGNKVPDIEGNQRVDIEITLEIEGNNIPKKDGNQRPESEGSKRLENDGKKKLKNEDMKISKTSSVIGKLVPLKSDSNAWTTVSDGNNSSFEDEAYVSSSHHKSNLLNEASNGAPCELESIIDEETKLQRKNALLERVKKLVEKCQTNFDFETSFYKENVSEDYGLTLKKCEIKSVPQSSGKDLKDCEVNRMHTIAKSVESQGKSSPNAPYGKKMQATHLCDNEKKKKVDLSLKNKNINEDRMKRKEKDKHGKSSKKLKAKNLFGNDSDDDSRMDDSLYLKAEASGAESRRTIASNVNEEPCDHHHADMTKGDAYHSSHSKINGEKRPPDKHTNTISACELLEKKLIDKKNVSNKHINIVGEENTSGKHGKKISNQKYHLEEKISNKSGYEVVEKKRSDGSASPQNTARNGEKCHKDKVFSIKSSKGISEKHFNEEKVSTKHSKEEKDLQGISILQKEIKVFYEKDISSKLIKNPMEVIHQYKKNDSKHKKEASSKHAKDRAQKESARESTHRKCVEERTGKKTHDKLTSKSLFSATSTNFHKNLCSKIMKLKTDGKKTQEVLILDSDELEKSDKSTKSESKSDKVKHEENHSSSRLKDIGFGIRKSKQMELKPENIRIVDIKNNSNCKSKHKDSNVYNDLFGDIDDINSSSNSNIPEVEVKDDKKTIKAEEEDDNQTFAGIIINEKAEQGDQQVKENPCNPSSTSDSSNVETGYYTSKIDPGNSGDFSSIYKARPEAKPENEQRIKQQKAALEIKVVQEVKKSLDPFYRNKSITKDEYKEIVAKCVKKVVNAECGDVIEPGKMHDLVLGYIKLFKHRQMKSHT